MESIMIASHETNLYVPSQQKRAAVNFQMIAEAAQTRLRRMKLNEFLAVSEVYLNGNPGLTC